MSTVPPDHRGYDRFPVITVPPDGTGGLRVISGKGLWDVLSGRGRQAGDPALILVDTYPGVDVAGLVAAATTALPGWRVIDIEAAAARPTAEINALLARNLTDDRVFGVLSHHTLNELYDPERLAALADRLRSDQAPTVVVGWGAGLLALDHGLDGGVVVLADLPRWEIQQRYRRGQPNWRCGNHEEDVLRKVKRGYFVEWRIADRHKRRLFAIMDFLLDSTRSVVDAHLVAAAAFRAGLDAAAARPFRLVPFFDPGPWGGTWMEDVVGLEPVGKNYAWCFDCVPEENSLLFELDGTVIEVPAMDLVLSRPRELLGARTYARFGAEFPIRFDFLDTMNGGNLSLQVHPLTDYITDTFGMHYTQDESYYLLDADDDATVYLGLRDDADVETMFAELIAAQDGEHPFDAERYVNRFPAAKHDHFLIPAGTVHCSGRDSMVLEISATPYLFTFKMWDWGRVGLDGVPRPVHLEHARANVQTDRRTSWVRENLVDRVEELASGPGWVEERTGLHELEFIEVRRHWFTGPVEHDTDGTVNVLNLVEGAQAVVSSPTGAFAPFVVHYAETFVVPAAVGRYTITPSGPAVGGRVGTVKAYVRGTRNGSEPVTTVG
ncbi:MAG TPA: class I mannose-6-phosphate isomerase [Microlunatus sp.]|nr:class I mannose-6-phosphate isomerase [Microlunatus sp.]